MTEQQIAAIRRGIEALDRMQKHFGDYSDWKPGDYEWIDELMDVADLNYARETITVMLQALEPAIWGERKPPVFGPPIGIIMKLEGDETLKLYPLKQKSSPAAQRQWVGLDGDEIRRMWNEASIPERSTMAFVVSFAQAIEAKLKEKNGIQ